MSAVDPNPRAPSLPPRSAWTALSEGQRVTLTLPQREGYGEDAVIAVLVTIDEAELRLDTVREWPPETFTEVQPCFVAFEEGRLIWALRGTVVAGRLGELRFRATDLTRLTQRRSSRVPARLPVDLRAVEGDGAAPVSTHSVDLSVHGALCEHPGGLSPGQPVEFSLKIAADVPVAGSATIVRVDDGVVALDFGQLGAAEREMLNGYVLCTTRAMIGSGGDLAQAA